MDVEKYLRRLDVLAEFASQSTRQKLRRFRNNHHAFPVPAECPESKFRIWELISVLKADAGLHYNPARRSSDDQVTFLGFTDSKDLLINGLLSNERRGTCNSIPVVVVAVGRRLGYPLFLSANRNHVWTRWDDGQGERFNIDARGPGGFGDEDDDYYRNNPHPMTPIDVHSGYYLRNFTPAD